jgi:hypothetical protein
VVEGAAGNGLPSGDESLPPERPQAPNQVDSIIQRWLVDLWLLSTGEEADTGSPFAREKDGEAFAMVCGGQLCLLKSKPSTVDALRWVGIEVS